MTAEANLVIHLTEEATKQINQVLDTEYRDPSERKSAGIRLRVIPGGCSGFQYGMDAVVIGENTPQSDVLEINGVKLLIDMFSAQYLNGVTVHYITNAMGSGFVFNNPNSFGSCGCGSSFNA